MPTRTMMLDLGRIAPRLAGTPLIVLLDVDGTLAPITARPDAAVVPPATRQAVTDLARAPGVVLGLVSGRAAIDARRLVDAGPAWVIGNHGAEVTSPDGETMVEPNVAPFEGAVAAATLALAVRTAAWSGVVTENKRWTATVHYRQAGGDDPVFVSALRELVADEAVAYGLVMTEGKKVFELRPPVRVDKGTAVLTLAERVGGLAAGASVLYAGDDVTDEVAFAALRARAPAAVTVHVNGAAEELRDTAAEYTVSDPMEMGTLLAWLAAARRGAR